MQLQNIRILVCSQCLDVPSIQLKTIILPPDPLPVFNPRPEQYDIEVPSNITTIPGVWFATMDGVDIVMMSKVTPSPYPDDPVLFPPDF